MIPDNIKKLYNIDEKKINHHFEYVHPIQLLQSSRIDIAAKYLYLAFKDVSRQYAEEVYSEHIRCMTKGAFIEPLSKKNNLKAFINDFNALYERMRDNGYDKENPIPVDRNYKILDGAHRVTVALQLGIELPVVKIEIDGIYDIYDQYYFEHCGIKQHILENIIRMYIKLQSNVYCINVWPSAQGHDGELNALINRHFDVIYKKEVFLKEEAALLYLAQIYSEYSWAQNSENGFANVYRKLLPCFPNDTPVRILFVEKKTEEDITTIKDVLRSIYNLKKHSLHITDNGKETYQMGEILLNNNSIDFLNNCNVLKFKNTLKLMKEAIKLDHMNRGQDNRNKVIFTGSLILALYGIRQAEDIDYIRDSDGDTASHNYLLKYYPTKKENLFCNPKYYFSFFDCKFLTLETVKEFKKRRNESKDRDDINLITLVGSKKNTEINFIRIKRRIVAKIQGLIIKIAHLTGTYETLRKFYKKIWLM